MTWKRITYALLYNLLAWPYIRGMTFDQQHSVAAILKNKTKDVTRPMNEKIWKVNQEPVLPFSHSIFKSLLASWRLTANIIKGRSAFVAK